MTCEIWVGHIQVKDVDFTNFNLTFISRYTGDITFTKVTKEGYWQFNVDKMDVGGANSKIICPNGCKAIADTGKCFIFVALFPSFTQFFYFMQNYHKNVGEKFQAIWKSFDPYQSDPSKIHHLYEIETKIQFLKMSRMLYRKTRNLMLISTLYVQLEYFKIQKTAFLQRHTHF